MTFTILGYIGPETIVPIASAIAAITGGIMMMGRSSLLFVRRCIGTVIPGLAPSKAPAEDSQTG